MSFTPQALTRENYLEVLEPYLNKGDFLLNLSVDVSSLALIELCHRRGSLYLDTCIEPWLGGYTDPSLTPSLRSNYALREHALDIGRQTGGGPTAVLSHGANPGLASAFVKQALLNIAADTGLTADMPAHRDDWAQLARALNIKVIHIAEQDTQVSAGINRRMSLSTPGLYSVSPERACSLRSWDGERMSVIGPRTDSGTNSAVMRPFTSTDRALRRGCAVGFHGWMLPWLSNHAWRVHFSRRLLDGKRR